MKISIFFAKVIALVLSSVLFTSNVSSEQITAIENKNDSFSIVETNTISSAQLMEIECPHCHEHITVDVNKTHAECDHCGNSIDFAG